MKRTLYINENERHIYVKVDGPSLIICSPYIAERRIPLPMIGRVIIFGNISIDSEILTCLADANIPVLFVSKWARSFSFSLNVHYAITKRSSKLDRLVKDQRKMTEFFNWAKDEKAFLEANVLKSLARCKAGINSTDYQEVILFFMPYDLIKWKTVRNIIRILFWSLIVEELLNKNLNPHQGLIHNRRPFGLVRDYAYIMTPEIDMQALQFFKSDSLDALIKPAEGAFLLTSRGIHNIINRFENKQYIPRHISQVITDKIFELVGEKI